MSEQFALFEMPGSLPEGLSYAGEFVSPAIEDKLILGIQSLPLQPFQFGQFEGKRRVASFGFRYDYGLRRLQRAEPIPAWLDEIVAKVEAFGGPATRSGRSFALNTTSESGSAGIVTNPTSTEYLAFHWHPDVNFGSVDPQGSRGNASRSMPNPDPST